MKFNFKTILYFIISLCFITFTVLFAIQIIPDFSWQTAFMCAYFAFYLICLILVSILFVYKFITNIISLNFEIDKLQSRKQKRAAAQAERAQTAKQAKIEKLQAELEELKKD